MVDLHNLETDLMVVKHLIEMGDLDLAIATLQDWVTVLEIARKMHFSYTTTLDPDDVVA